MDNPFWAMAGEKVGHSCTIGEVELEEPETRVFLYVCETVVFEAHVIIGIEIIDPNYRVSACKQALSDVKPDEPCRPGYENMHMLLLIRSSESLPRCVCLSGRGTQRGSGL